MTNVGRGLAWTAAALLAAAVLSAFGVVKLPVRSDFAVQAAMVLAILSISPLVK